MENVYVIGEGKAYLIKLQIDTINETIEYDG